MLILIDTENEVLEILSPVNTEELTTVFEKLKPSKLRKYFLSIRKLIDAPIFTENEIEEFIESEKNIVPTQVSDSYDEKPLTSDCPQPKPPSEK